MSANESVASPSGRHDVLIIGGGAGGIALAASLHKRRTELDIAISSIPPIITTTSPARRWSAVVSSRRRRFAGRCVT